MEKTNLGKNRNDKPNNSIWLKRFKRDAMLHNITIVTLLSVFLTNHDVMIT
jgi:hypothetical protein